MGGSGPVLEREKSGCQDFPGKATAHSGLLLWWPFDFFLAPEPKHSLVFLVCSEEKGRKVLNKLGLRFHIRELMNGYKSFKSSSVYA